MTWLHWYVGIPASLLLGYAAYLFLKQNHDIAKKTSVSFLSWTNLVVALLLFLFLLFTGHGMIIGGTGYDTPWRNAVYYDLIAQSWPVTYEFSGCALVYYLTYWIVPAGICHVFGLQKNAADIILFFWTFTGLHTFVLLLLDYVKAKKTQYVPLLFIFLFWSGLNTIAMLMESAAGVNQFYIDTEWGWNTWQFTGFVQNGYELNYMVRTTFDSLANIYHQFVPMLLCTILFLKYRSVKGLLFITLLLIPFSPLGAIGLCILAMTEILKQLVISIRHHNFILKIKDILSITNIIPVCTIVPVFFLYFTANNALGHTNSLWSAPLAAYGIPRIAMFTFYYLIYFGIFLVLCHVHVKDRTLFWSVLISLIILPLFKVGRTTDFGWNASMPGFYIIMVFIMQNILIFSHKTLWNKRSVATIVILLIAATTPCLQMASQYKKCIEDQSTLVYVDAPNIGNSFSNKPLLWVEKNYSDLRNFESPDYRQTKFYMYLAR